MLGHGEPSPFPPSEGGSRGGQQKGKGHRERSSIDLLICVVFVFLVSFFYL